MLSFNSISPLTFYFISMICFVVSNLIESQSRVVYYGTLLLGLLFFLVGFFKRMNTKK